MYILYGTHTHYVIHGNSEELQVWIQGLCDL